MMKTEYKVSPTHDTSSFATSSQNTKTVPRVYPNPLVEQTVEQTKSLPKSRATVVEKNLRDNVSQVRHQSHPEKTSSAVKPAGKNGTAPSIPNSKLMWEVKGGKYEQKSLTDQRLIEQRNIFIGHLQEAYEANKKNPKFNEDKNIALLIIKNGQSEPLKLMAVSGKDEKEYSSVQDYVLVRYQNPMKYETFKLPTDGEHQYRKQDSEAKMLEFIPLVEKNGPGKNVLAELRKPFGLKSKKSKGIFYDKDPQAAVSIIRGQKLLKTIVNTADPQESSNVVNKFNNLPKTKSAGVDLLESAARKDPVVKLLIDTIDSESIDLTQKNTTIQLHSKIVVCPSCRGVFEQFSKEFPNVTIVITAGVKPSTQKTAVVSENIEKAEAGQLPNAPKTNSSSEHTATDKTSSLDESAVSSTLPTSSKKENKEQDAVPNSTTDKAGVQTQSTSLSAGNKQSTDNSSPAENSPQKTWAQMAASTKSSQKTTVTKKENEKKNAVSNSTTDKAGVQTQSTSLSAGNKQSTVNFSSAKNPPKKTYAQKDVGANSSQKTAAPNLVKKSPTTSNRK